MMMPRQTNISITSACVLFMANVSLAWTNLPAISYSSPPRSCTALSAQPSALQYRSGDDQIETTNAIITDALDTEFRLQIALRAAQDADRHYGLCTPESNSAWQVVDDIYLSSSASRQVEDNVKKV
eukprot:860410_1